MSQTARGTDNRSDVRPGPRALSFAAVGLLTILVTIGIDRAVSDSSLLREWPPQGSWPWVLRSAGLALGSFTLLYGLRRWSSEMLPHRFVLPAPRYVEMGAIITAVAMAVGGAAMLFIDPEHLTKHMREDRTAEWASFFFAIGAGVAVIRSALHVWRQRTLDATKARSAAVLALIGAAMVLVALEEVSWFQRVLDVESPDAFAENNIQGELNLHNFVTAPAENLFYGGAFVFCVAIPFVIGDRHLPGRWRWLEPAVPTSTVLWSSAVTAGLVYLMWNVVFVQVTLWGSLAVVLLAGRMGPTSKYRPIVLVGLSVTAIAFLFEGDRMFRIWDNTELRETIIAWNFLVYAVGVRSMTRPSDD